MTTTTSFELLEFKADDEKQGFFAALVSVFGNVDRNGDRMMKGAFLASIKRRIEQGKPWPVVWTHDHGDPQSFIGSVDPASVQETPKGLVVAGKLDIETNPRARQVWELLKDGRINNWSFAFTTVRERIAKDLARELVEVELHEVGPTLVGANSETATLAVKSAAPALEPAVDMAPFEEQFADLERRVDAALEAKIGRLVSTKTEAAIRAALAHLQSILDGLTPAEDETIEKADEPEVSAGTDPVETTSDADPIAEAQRFVAERGRLQLAEFDAWLGERS